MKFQQKVKKIIKEKELELNITCDTWNGTTIYIDAPAGFTMDGDLHGYVSHGCPSEKRENLWQDLYERLKDEELQKCDCGACLDSLEEIRLHG